MHLQLRQGCAAITVSQAMPLPESISPCVQRGFDRHWLAEEEQPAVLMAGRAMIGNDTLVHLSTSCAPCDSLHHACIARVHLEDGPQLLQSLSARLQLPLWHAWIAEHLHAYSPRL